MKLCLVGKWGEVSTFKPWLPAWRRCVDRSWAVSKRVRVSPIAPSLCSFEFEDEMDFVSVLARGSRRFLKKKFSCQAF